MDAQLEDLRTFYIERNPKDWFFGPEGFDDELRKRFGDLVHKARAGQLDFLANDAQGALKLVVLLDQIPRNIYRGSKESYSSDTKALDIATKSIALMFDQEIGKHSQSQQFLFYMPLMHAEDLLSQIACCSLMQSLQKDCPVDDEEMREVLKQGVSAAQRHLKCILQLGRFPKRNTCLGRDTTSEEENFLQEHPLGF